MISKGKWLVLALTAAVTVSFAGCSMVSVNEARDRAQVVAEVNGVQITKGDYKDSVNNILSQYGMSEETMLADSANSETYKQGVLDTLVDRELVYQAAEKEGLVDLSEENLNELIEQEKEWMASTFNYYKSEGEENGEEDPKAYAREKMAEYLKTSGITDLEETAKKTAQDNAVNAMYEKIIEDVEVTEDDVREYYDRQVEMQDPIMDQDPSSYAMYKSLGDVYVNPAGSRYVKNLLISLPSEVTSEVQTLRQSGDDEAADAVLAEELAKIKDQADEAYQRLQDGEDIDALIEELGGDSGMTVEPGKTYGYLVYDGGTEYVQEFQDAAMGLEKEGDYTEPVGTDFGYHIIYYANDGEGPVDFDMVKDDIESTLQTEKENTRVTEFLDEQKENATIKTYVKRV